MFKDCYKPVAAKFDDLLAATKINELLHKKQAEKKKNTLKIILAIAGGVILVAGIAYLVYKFLTPSYPDEFEDDDFDIDFDTEFEDEDEDNE